MAWLPDRIVDRLRTATTLPDFTGTRYELLDAIGRGGMGCVYLAHDRLLDRDVAIKVLDDPAADPALAERLLAEARVLARLEHPGIVPVHDAGVLADGRPFSVMKLVRGRDLAAVAGERPDVPERLRLFERICEAVAFAHARGVIHRDLKPANIMVGPFGEVLVLDWGLAKLEPAQDRTPAASSTDEPPAVDARGRVPAPPPAGDHDRSGAPAPPMTRHGLVLGTPGFMAPEQRRGDPVDVRADVFALGVLLGWLADPDQGREPGARSGRLPRALAAIVERATAPAPDDRYASVTDLGADVRRYVDGLAVSAYRERSLERLGRFARRHRVAIALVAAYLAMRVALLVLGRL